MKIKLVAFGIAKDILQQSTKELSVDPSMSIAALKQQLIDNYPDFSDLRSLKFAINEDYQDDDFQLSENDEVVIIPPVSGG